MQLSSKFAVVPPAQNPFASASTSTSTSSSNNEIVSNPFFLTQKPIAFGAPSGPVSSSHITSTAPSGLSVWPKVIKTSSNDNQKPSFNPFAGAIYASNSSFENDTSLDKSVSPDFECSNSVPQSSSTITASSPQEIIGVPNYQNLSESLNTSSSRTKNNESSLISTRTTSIPSDKHPSSFAEKIESHLRAERIIPPSLSNLDYNKDPNEFLKSATELRKEFLKYRDKVRTSLIKANLLDDPNVPKKLKDAIDFKGTCDKMCPEYECITRMVDRRYDKTERNIRPDGTLSTLPNPVKMVKALARSAAGQDAPLPSDIRTAAALRKTIDYLFKTLLAERELETVHGFLWDRTRAVRRDFVFHSSMTPSELVDQVYCLERIIRFHAISLHHMSKEGISSEGFSDQQEREQLSKSLLSLIHAYEDCKLQGIHCENEIEFKAYYVLFNGEIPGIMGIVQSWGWEIWENSEIIRIAVSLSESLQNTWDVHGPLYPASTSEISQNAYSRFFSIVEDPNVSYTMACFAEIYFNKIRKAILRTILSSYRKQRGQTKDWTAQKLNQFLRFDTEEEIEPFVQLYGIQFSENDGERYLSFDSTNNIQDPHPLPRQPHSYHFVEKKRGRTSLSDAINRSIYEKVSPKSNDEQSLFVEDNQGGINPPYKISKTEGQLCEDQLKEVDSRKGIFSSNSDELQSISGEEQNSSSLFDHLATQKTSTQISNLGSHPTPSSSEPRSLISNLLSSHKIEPPSGSLSSIHEVSKTNSSNQSIFNFTENAVKNSSNSLGTSVFSNISTKTIETNVGEKQPQTLSENPESNLIPRNFNLTPSSGQPSLSVQKKKKVSWSTPLNYEQIQPNLVLSHSAQPSTFSHESSLPADVPSSAVLPCDLSTYKFNLNKSDDFSITHEADLNNQQLRLDYLTDWIVNGDFGLLQQFSEHHACIIVHDAFNFFAMQQKLQALREAERQDLMEAENFRWRSLAVKYGYFWREQARNLRLKRKGREAREARRLMAQKSKVEKARPSTSFVEDFRSSVALRRRPRDSLEILSDESVAQFSKSDLQGEMFSAELDNEPSQKRQCSERSTVSENSNMSRQNRCTPGKLRSPSLLSDPSFLSGEPRIHLIPRYSNKDERRKQTSGVQTDYFRLKARGIITMPQGTRLP